MNLVDFKLEDCDYQRTDINYETGFVKVLLKLYSNNSFDFFDISVWDEEDNVNIYDHDSCKAASLKINRHWEDHDWEYFKLTENVSNDIVKVIKSCYTLLDEVSYPVSNFKDKLGVE